MFLRIYTNKHMEAVASVCDQGTYVYLSPSSASRLAVRDLLNTLPKELLDHPDVKAEKTTKYHVTMMFSGRQPAPLEELLANVDTPVRMFARATHVSLFGPENNVLVLELESEDLDAYHDELKQLLTWDSDYDWKPHMTFGEVSVELAESEVLADWIEQVNEWLQTEPLTLEFGNPGLDYCTVNKP